jgi:ABC-type sulfate/molybdate transport systems ATPase subunit
MLEVDLRVARRMFDVAAAFTVTDGERLALLGPSGSGKTTILEAVAGLVAVAEGRILLGGRELTVAGGESGRARTTRTHQVPLWAREVALLRQDPGLFPHLSVLENLTYAVGRHDDGELARLVQSLQLGGLLSESPRGISGGQAQRVALGRALLSRHRALLLDEPYTGLDAPLRRELTQLVRDQVAARSVPAVLVAHELTEAQAFADRLGVLDQGRLLQLGTPSEVVRHPATPRVAELVGYRGLAPVIARGRPLLAAVHPERVCWGARPERGPVVEGRIVGRRPSGTGWEVDVELAPGVPAAAEPGRGGAAGVAPRPRLSFRSSESPAGSGTDVVLTLLDPPLFDLAAAHGAPSPPDRA